ncbi:MAG: hypothetical protein WAN46_07190 [Gammaproteobacteria bacterium]
MPILRQWSLILLCFSMACAVGGGLYEHLVLTPLWSRSPAASGRAGILHDHARLERLLLHTRDAGFSEGPSGFSANCGPHGTGGSVDLLDMVQGTPRHRVFLVLSVGPLLAAELTLMLARGLCATAAAFVTGATPPTACSAPWAGHHAISPTMRAVRPPPGFGLVRARRANADVWCRERHDPQRSV